MRAHAPRTLFPSWRIRGEPPYYRARLRYLRWFINVRASTLARITSGIMILVMHFSLRTFVPGKWQLFSTN